ncbi:MAG: hypothetical protein NVS4B3_17060 [Gemmatimonadaceae bacterium]
MTHYPGALWLLAVIALVQGVFVVMTVALLLVKRSRDAGRRRRRAATQTALSGPLQHWMLHGGAVDRVVAALRHVPAVVALEQVTVAISPRVPPSQLGDLTAALRRERWVRNILRGKRSPFWWRRLGAGRLLSVIATPNDRALIYQLLKDPHPAVQAVATACLVRLADAGLTAHVLDHLPEQPLVVRLYQFSVLRATWQTTVHALNRRLVAHFPAHKLEIWINLAESIGDPACLGRVAPMHTHRVAEVRIAVAKALKRLFDPRAVPALISLLADGDWRVRAQAARSIGVIGASEAVPLLAAALYDPSWWVRFRAALSLAQLGDGGRRELRHARDGSDRFAREMAALVSGLSDGAVLELAEG